MLKMLVVDGNGGSGKSLTAKALVDMYLNAEQVGISPCKVAGIDGSSQVDSMDLCGRGGLTPGNGIIQAIHASLGTESGWIQLANDLEGLLEAEEEIRVIVSMPAGVGLQVFDGSIPVIGEILERFHAIPIWVLNRTRAAISALAVHLEMMPKRYARGLVVTNLFFGERKHFQIWDDSRLRREIVESNAWREASLPSMQDLLMDRIGRTPLHIAEELGTTTGKLSLSERYCLNHWRRHASESLRVIETIGDHWSTTPPEPSGYRRSL